ncbi:hypothetical protein [Zymomonas mobilis]|nr:hypothetical protein [Zymomonas mobilis]
MAWLILLLGAPITALFDLLARYNGAKLFQRIDLYLAARMTPSVGGLE